MDLRSFIKRYAPPFLLGASINLRDNFNFYRLYYAMKRNGRFMDVKLDTNNVCNLRCAICYTNDLEPRQPRFMTLDEFSIIAKRLFPVARSLALSNATEPTMTKNFNDFIKIATSYGVPSVSYCTNGLLLNEDIMKETILNKVSFVVVSLDGATKETYESVRVNSNFEKVIANLELFQALKKRYNSELPEISISYTAFDRNIDESIDFIKKFHHLFDRFILNHLLTRKRNSKFPGQRVSKDKFDSVCDEAGKYCREYGKKLEFVFNPVRSNRQNISKCPLALSYRLIMSNGDIFLCSKEKLCNIVTDDYFKIVKEGTLLKEMMHKKHPYCKTCMS